jgi:hypothetical protein
MCTDQWSEQAELLALFLAEQIGACPHCGSVNLKHGAVSCPPRPFVLCDDCKRALA